MKLNILQSNLVIGVIGLFMIASTLSMLFYVYQENQADLTRNIAQDRKIEKLAAENIRLNEIQISLQQEQGNISAQARAKIISSIIRNENETIPRINNTLTNINQSLQHIVNVTSVPQSNLTAQRQAVSNIEEMKDSINIVKGSILSLNNKVNELFFLENKPFTSPGEGEGNETK